MAIATSQLQIDCRSRRPRLTSTSRTWSINFRLTIGPMRSPSQFGEVCCKSDSASLLKTTAGGFRGAGADWRPGHVQIWGYEWTHAVTHPSRRGVLQIWPSLGKTYKETFGCLWGPKTRQQLN